jgi:membrane carboxypeptidase/penicillin-binding protein
MKNRPVTRDIIIIMMMIIIIIIIIIVIIIIKYVSNIPGIPKLKNYRKQPY